MREPTLDELFAFNALIMKSVAKRYEGGLIVEDPRGKHAPTYLPEETQENKGDIWDLLIELWGELVTIDALEQIREETHRGRSRAQAMAACILRRGGRGGASALRFLSDA